MKELIKWLREIEHIASRVYFQASEMFSNDNVFKKFLTDIAEDEAWHYHVMGSAEAYLGSKPNPTPAISIDKETSDTIFKYFDDIQTGLDQRTISKDQLLVKIIGAELSEWNHIFLYVVNYLKKEANEFIYPATQIQAHIKQIENFLAENKDLRDLLKKIKEIPPVWVENILVVDDDPMLTDIVKAILKGDGNIDIAHNGKHALELIENKFYKLIISDVNMPVMDGITCYKETINRYPSLKNRFLFMTGGMPSERREFFSENNIPYLKKPVQIKILREAALKIILSK